ncbi:MAG: hypothetical protein AAFZ63_29035 [Bacteroidota bacterium]
MQAQSYPFNPQIMGVDVMKQQLIERIQQGDEQLVRVLFAVSEALEKEESAAAYEASLTPMSVDELIARAEESNRAIEAGEYVDIEEALAELGD